MRVSVFGLGYVGAVSAGCLARSGHTVIGVDVNQLKVDSINGGQTPIIEPDIGEIIETESKSGRLSATTSVEDAVNGSDLSLICVGTPSQANGSLELHHVEQVSRQIGAALRDKKEKHLVVLRSTVLPGTTDEVVIPALTETSGGVAGTDFDICFHPEFLREGSSVYDFFNPPKIVVGAPAGTNVKPLMDLYEGIEAPRFETTLRVAEMVKYVDNAYHALKVAFANEMGSIAREVGVHSHEVMDIFCADEKLNISKAYLKPGFAFGGSCLPKDLRALGYRGRSLDLDLPLLNSVIGSNTSHVERVVDRLVRGGRKHVGFVGMSFKANTDDLRESPIVHVIETLIGKGFEVSIFDPEVSLARLVGANREYIEKHLPHVASLLVDSVEDMIRNVDTVVVGHRIEGVETLIQKMTNQQRVLDLVGIDANGTDAMYEGVCW